MTTLTKSMKQQLLADVIIVAILIVTTAGTQFMTPRYTSFIEGDLSISHPAGDSVSTFPWLYLFYIVPIIIIIAIYAGTEKKSQWNTCRVLLFCALAFLLNETVTSFAKNVTGRPRPAFFDICDYPYTLINDTKVYGTFGKVGSVLNCRATSSKIKDAFRSYPSGHSSHSMCAALMTYLMVLCLIRSLKGLRKEILRIVEVVWLIICMSLPLYVGSSRIWDYKHRGDDVLAGYLVGIVSAFIAFYISYGFDFERVEIRDSPEKQNAGSSSV